MSAPARSGRAKPAPKGATAVESDDVRYRSVSAMAGYGALPSNPTGACVELSHGMGVPLSFRNPRGAKRGDICRQLFDVAAKLRSGKERDRE